MEQKRTTWYDRWSFACPLHVPGMVQQRLFAVWHSVSGRKLTHVPPVSCVRRLRVCMSVSGRGILRRKPLSVPSVSCGNTGPVRPFLYSVVYGVYSSIYISKIYRWRGVYDVVVTVTWYDVTIGECTQWLQQHREVHSMLCGNSSGTRVPGM